MTTLAYPLCANRRCQRGPKNTRRAITPQIVGVRFYDLAMCCCDACADALAVAEWQRRPDRDNRPCTVPGCEEPRLPGQTRCKAHFREAQRRSQNRLAAERRAAR